VELPSSVLGEIVRQAEAGYPEEICGLVVGIPGRPETYGIRQIPNVANHERPTDPDGLPRDAKTAYLMDPLEELRVLREVDERGWTILCIYHSHPDHEATFSAMDRDRAVMAPGEPLWPDAAYLVVAVMQGRAAHARSFAWQTEARLFAEQAVSLPPPA
jgi:[CysO sulfur-carrier protein]-S-L-cysteine hydrolase